MQDLLVELLWRNAEIDEAADHLCQSLPGFSAAKQAYDDLSEQLRAAAGHDLYDRWPGVRVMIPRTVVITTEYFDRFIIDNGLQYVINSEITDE